jgi:hypothetical protein
VFAQLLPQRLDNTYRGLKLALWVFVLVVAFRMVQMLGVLFNGASILRDGHGIPLNTFTPADVQTLVAIFALSALCRLVLLLLCVLVLVRYRSAIPLMFALLVLDGLTNDLVLLRFVPIVGVPSASIVSVVLVGVMLVGLALSLWRPSIRTV